MQIELPIDDFTVDVDAESGVGHIVKGFSKTGHEVHDEGLQVIEDFILGHACAGIDISTAAYLEGVESALFCLRHGR